VHEIAQSHGAEVSLQEGSAGVGTIVCVRFSNLSTASLAAVA